MTRDKQLLSVRPDQVIEKRHLDQALNVKEFAVLAGISYSAARTWFKQPGFPVFFGVVFWQDFVQWRKGKTGVQRGSEAGDIGTGSQRPVAPKTLVRFTGRAARILAEAA